MRMLPDARIVAMRLEHEKRAREVSEKAYWRELEHLYAGMAMQGIVSSYEAMREISKESDIPQYVANMALGLAHALVEKMKEADR